MAEGRLRHRFDEYLGKAEVAIYSILAAMLSVTAFAALRPVGWLQSLDNCRSDAARIGPTAGRADASGDSANGPHIHPLAFSGYRTIPGGGV